MAHQNTNLRAAKSEQFNEFYTLYQDIANEMPHYRNIFRARLYTATAMTQNRVTSGITFIITFYN